MLQFGVSKMVWLLIQLFGSPRSICTFGNVNGWAWASVVICPFWCMNSSVWYYGLLFSSVYIHNLILALPIKTLVVMQTFFIQKSYWCFLESAELCSWFSAAVYSMHSLDTDIWTFLPLYLFPLSYHLCTESLKKKKVLWGHMDNDCV